MYEVVALGEEIARVLHEPNRKRVTRVIEIIGLDQTVTFLGQALEVEAHSRMVTTTHKRQHTLSAVFFRLLRKNLSAEDRRAIFLPLSLTEKK